jgi:RNA polymerase II elongation factor ELL
VGLPVPSGRRGGPPAKATSRSKLLSQNRSFSSDTTRSGQSSGTGSPSLGPTSVPLSQQQAEQAKATRKPVVHLLALGPTSEDALRDKIPHASSSDLKQALQKVGDLNQSTGKWELRRNFYKELDVWSYDYETSDDRQRAIDNAVKQYDKLRLGVSEPQWDRLLPKAERGTGKCLSKLQAQIAQGPVQRAPKINVQKAEDSGRDTSNDGDEDLFGEKKDPKAKGESTARPSSQPSVTKTKKVSEQAAQAKRLLSKTKPKPAPIKKAKEPKKPAGKVLSSQFVSESDEEDDYMTTTKAEPNPMKRSREDEEETSDSSTPLSKKVKESHNHRVSDASQSSRATTTSTSSNSNKAKGNSPQKSSPLASSPPTNASDIESYSGHTSSSASPAHPNVKVSRSPIYKRHQKSSSVTSSVSSSSQRSLNPKVVDLARRYRSFYPKYEALHREVANSEGRRNIEREQELLDMHERLSELKKQILAGIIDVETAPASLN